MTHLGANLNITATVLGYLALMLVISFVAFVITKLVRELAHDRRRKRYEADKWEYERSTWLIDQFENYQQDRYDTDILDFPQTVELQAVSYLKEKEHKRGRRKDR